MKLKFNLQIFKIILLNGLVIFNIAVNFSQSDTPCASSPLTLGPTCSYITIDASANTLSTAIGAPSCGHFGTILVEEDTWFSFVAPASGSVNLESSTVAGSTYDYADMVVYSGSCTSMTEIDCFGGYGGSTMPHFELTGLTPGATYFVRLYGVWDSNGGPKTIDFCAYEPSPPPSNDECSGAIPALINPDQWCNLLTPGTISGATPSSTSFLCGFGSTPNDDVWFSFEATNTTHFVHIMNVVGSTSDLSYSLYTGTCGSLSTETCGNVWTGLTIGQTYFVRVYSTGNSAENTTFDLCITNPPDMPACATNPAAGNTVCTATPICNLDGYCGSTSGTYTPEYWSGLISPFCGTIENNSFLSFTAAASTISFYVWVNNSTTNAGIQIMVFSASDCDSGPVTSYTCWSPGTAYALPTLVSASGLTVGEEYYIMIDGNGGDIADYVISAYEGFQIPVDVSSVSGDTSICLGQSIDLMATGGSGNYVWSPSTTLNTSNGDTVTSTPIAVGPITYNVISSVPNSLCPSTSADFTLNVTSFVSGTDTQVACGSYTWIDGVTYTSSNNTATYTIAGGSASGCDSIVTLDLTISSSVTGVDTQVACGSYTWIDGVTYTSSNNTATYTIAGGSASGCDSIVTLDLTISSSVTGVDTQVACDSYTWIDGVTYTSSNNTATYTIAGGSASGCDSIVTLDLTISSSVPGTDTQVACGSYTWIDGVTYTSSNNTATYTIVGGSASGCDSIVTLGLTIFPEVVINLGEDIGICNETLELSPGYGFQSYLWNTGSVLESITINSDGIYSVNVTDQNGCQGYDAIEVTNSCEGSIWVPNAFTPNGDLFNQSFFPIMSGVDESSYRFYIYNRWGELIFETNKIGEGWDGSYHSFPVQDGVYVWKISVKFIDKTEVNEKIGHVTLLR